MKLNKFKNGFTLVETIVAMTVTILILGIGLMVNTFIQKKRVLAEKQFFETLQAAVNESSLSAKINHTPLQIDFEKRGEVIVQTNVACKITTRKIPIPKTIRLAGHHQVLIATSGFISPQTIRWYGSGGQLKYLQKFQLGWSGFNLEKQEIDGIYDR